MKKLLLVLMSLILFSCNDDMEIAKLREGVYTATFKGRCLYKGIYYPYTQAMKVGITITSETQYYISSYYAGFASDKAFLSVYDKNNVRGDFYLPWYASSWSKGTLDGVIDNNSIKGTFTGIERGVDNITHEISEMPIEDGVFTMVLIN